MNWRSVWAIARKDLKEVQQNKAAWIPAIVLPVIFAIVFPLIFSVLPQVMPVKDIQRELGDMDVLLKNLPPSVQLMFNGLTLEQMFTVYMTAFLLAPLFLIMPLMFSSIVGADSFVGERERKTMEALLYSPTTDVELFLGKVLASVIPAISLSWLTYLIYIIVVNVGSFNLFGRFWFPLAPWWPMMFWLTPAFALLGISATVMISARVKTFMEAYQLTGSLVIVVLALVVGQATGVLFLGVGMVLLIGTILWIVDAILIYFNLRIFKRSSLIANL
ncbi:MAG: ABC transporter permease subunit [Bacteroidota bacterium]|jgi:ABC-type Na+ efflux pump permease subunit